MLLLFCLFLVRFMSFVRFLFVACLLFCFLFVFYICFYNLSLFDLCYVLCCSLWILSCCSLLFFLGKAATVFSYQGDLKIGIAALADRRNISNSAIYYVTGTNTIRVKSMFMMVVGVPLLLLLPPPPMID